MYCMKCGKEVKGNFCENCGSLAHEDKQKETATEGQQPAKKKLNGCMVAILVIIAVFGVLIIAIAVGVSGMEPASENQNKSMVAKHIEVTPEQGKQIDDIFILCGINKVDVFEHDSLLDNIDKDGTTGYRLTYGGIKNIIVYLNEDKTVYEIRYSDHDLYADNAKVASLDDYTVSIEEINKYQIMCQEAVKSILKSPSTAKFPTYNHWGWKQEKNTITVQGYVDSQNSFGANLRSEFQFIIDMDGDKIKSFIFDGKELM